MATVDPNIALGYKPIQIENPMNQYAMMSQIQAGQNQNALAQYQLATAKRGDEKVNFLNQRMAERTNKDTGQIDYPGLYKDVAEGGFGSYLPELIKQKQAADKEAGAIKKQTAETIGLEFKNRNAELDKAISQIAAFNTPQDTIAAIDKNLASGKIDQEKADWLKKSLAQAPNFRTWQKTTLSNNLDAKDRLHQEYQDKMATIAQGNLGVAAGNLAVNQYNATKPVYSEAAGGFITVPTAKNPTSTIIPLANPEATTKGKVITQGKTDVSDIATLMSKSYAKLNESEGITSTSRTGKSNLGSSAQSSMAGQFIGGALGTKEQSERDFIKSQRPLLVQAIVKATGITAGQINSNNELKNLLDAATDPNRGYETNIRTLNELNKRYGLGGDVISLSPTPKITKSGASVSDW
jgi:hypothetical protein